MSIFMGSEEGGELILLILTPILLLAAKITQCIHNKTDVTFLKGLVHK